MAFACVFGWMAFGKKDRLTANHTLVQFETYGVVRGQVYISLTLIVLSCR